MKASSIRPISVTLPMLPGAAHSCTSRRPKWVALRLSSAGHVAYLPLEYLSAGTLRTRVVRHLEIYGRYRTDRTKHRADWYRSLDEITAWLWEAAVGPVLDCLEPGGEAVFVPGGLLGLLPMHAAWTPDPDHPTGRRYALDAAAISYTPNALSLQVAQDAAAEFQPSKVLAVSEPRPVPASALPSAQYEVMAVLSCLRGTSKVLAGGEATKRAFQREASDATVLHLACHGYADLVSPLDSGLLLAGGAVTLREMINNYPMRVRLAVLSACETALPGVELPDEVVAFPTGLLQSGVAGVIASQWSVPDRATAMLMAEVLPPVVAH